jgi:hypothetical protein
VFLGLIIIICIQTWLGDALVVSGIRTAPSSNNLSLTSLISSNDESYHVLDLPVLLCVGQQSMGHCCARMFAAQLNW